MGRPSNTILAAGVVLIRRTKNGLLVCVLHRKRQRDWSLPKGKLDAGEHLIEAARRETIEETGSDVVLGAHLQTQRYRVDSRPKAVYYWVATERSGGPGFKPNKEVDRIRWMPIGKAADILTYPRDAVLVDHVAHMRRTTPLVIMRHADAVKHSDFGGKDRERPLTKQGERDAEVDARLLDAFGIEQIISSDSRRCVQSVRPLAKLAGLDIDRESILSEEKFDKKPGAVTKMLSSVLKDPTPTVICTHRPVLPDLMAFLRKELRLSRATRLMSPNLEPGEMVVIHRPVGKGRTLVERHRP